MRILVVNVFYAPQSIGGATRVVEDNVRDFAASDRVEDVAVFCSVQGGSAADHNRVYQSPDALVHATTTQLVANADFMVSDPVMAARFGAFVDMFCPDIIHFHCIQRLTSDICLIAAERDIPYVITMHDGWWVSDLQFLIDSTGTVQLYDYNDPSLTRERFGEAAVERQMALKPALDGAARLLTVSETFKHVVESAGLDGLGVTPNGVVEREALPKPRTEKTTIGYLAGAAHYKGFDHLYAAFHRGKYDRIALTIVDHSLKFGDEVHETWGATEVKRIGFVPQNRVAELYQGMHVVAVPSLWPESFGLIAREALQSGAWLIASNRGAASEDVREGVNGHVFNFEDHASLDRVLAQVNAAPERYQTPPPPTPLTRTGDQSSQLLALYETVLTKVSAPA